jgi:RsiW-degrading membrane proteinase PrsW (M82 family)
MESSAFAIAFLGGLIPALFWLWFWLKEDAKKPEPLRLIALTFIGGMLVVPLVLPLQRLAIEYFTDASLIWVWVTVEEVLKYAVALIIVLWHKAVDEPIDLIIYMIAIALGFSALENALFIFNPLLAGEFTDSLITGKFRFLGATLLHVLASGTVGVFLALAFYKSRALKLIAGTVGLCVAIVLHALFNFSIMNASGETILGVFLFVWMGVIVLFLVFEKVKLLERTHHSSTTPLL